MDVLQSTFLNIFNPEFIGQSVPRTKTRLKDPLSLPKNPSSEGSTADVTVL